jgi:hypothetical protein
MVGTRSASMLAETVTAIPTLSTRACRGFSAYRVSWAVNHLA